MLQQFIAYEEVKHLNENIRAFMFSIKQKLKFLVIKKTHLITVVISFHFDKTKLTEHNHVICEYALFLYKNVKP